MISNERKWYTFSTVTHTYSDINHGLVRSARMYEMREGFSPTGRIRRAFASFCDFDHTNTLNRWHPLQFCRPWTTMRFRETSLKEQNVQMSYVEHERNGNSDILIGSDEMLPLVRKKNTLLEWLVMYHTGEHFIDTDVEWAKRARDFTEFVLYSVVRLPSEKVSMVSTKEFIIFARLVISRSDVFFSTRVLSRHAGHLIILAAG